MGGGEGREGLIGGGGGDHADSGGGFVVEEGEVGEREGDRLGVADGEHQVGGLLAGFEVAVDGGHLVVDEDRRQGHATAVDARPAAVGVEGERGPALDGCHA